MAVDPKDVKVWAVVRGISHPVQCQAMLGTRTLCGTVLVGDHRRKTRTKKLCAECARRLKESTHAK